jgi:Stage II sporulation protein E (SpoIIE)
VTTIDVVPGALLCFYTDGLVESRNTLLDAGLERLCASIVAGPVDSVCAEVMARLVGSDAPGDDVAILALRRRDSGEIGPLDLVVPALPWSLRDIRFAVRRWLSAVGAARWRPPRGENRGRGTMFMQKCNDDLRIDHGHTGTNVVIRRRLGEEAPR